MVYDAAPIWVMALTARTSCDPLESEGLSAKRAEADSQAGAVALESGDHPGRGEAVAAARQPEAVRAACQKQYGEQRNPPPRQISGQANDEDDGVEQRAEDGRAGASDVRGDQPVLDPFAQFRRDPRARREILGDHLRPPRFCLGAC